MSPTEPPTPHSNDADSHLMLPFPLDTKGSPNPDRLEQVAPFATQFLDDPIALRQLSKRVFELLIQDLKAQQIRRRGYGR